MHKERILDIGIGAGGAYIMRNTGPHEQRVGVDIDKRKMPGLRMNYPSVLAIFANAEHLPFGANTFSRIEIVLPSEYLLIPGLQTDHFALRKYKGVYVQTHPNGWYPEFHRVLVPQGQLVIFADLWVNPVQVEKTSQRFFTVKRVRRLTMAEFRALGTSTVTTVIDKSRRAPYVYELGKKWEDLLVAIDLRSTKRAWSI